MNEKEIIKSLKEYKEKHDLDVLEICLYENKVYFVGRKNGAKVVNVEDKL